jgi:hypothetical protein
MKYRIAIAAMLLVSAAAMAQAPPAPEAALAGDISGMYSLLHEGEFVQIVVDDQRVTGVASHFRNEDPDKGQFVDVSLEKATLDGTTLSFRTKSVEGEWLEFTGTVERGPARSRSEEGYYLVRGTLTEHFQKAGGKAEEKRHSITLRSFPLESEPERPVAPAPQS